jgi:hypothetical protein
VRVFNAYTLALRFQRNIFAPMSDKYKINNKDGVYFVTLTVVDWIDVFTWKEHKERIVESLQFVSKIKGWIFTYGV